MKKIQVLILIFLLTTLSNLTIISANSNAKKSILFEVQQCTEYNINSKLTKDNSHSCKSSDLLLTVTNELMTFDLEIKN